jgi:hypothetical protein
MEHRWGSCRAWRFKKSRASGLERHLDKTWTHKNSSLDLNRTWDGTSLGLVQDLALKKRAEPPPWSSKFLSGQMSRNIR